MLIQLSYPAHEGFCWSTSSVRWGMNTSWKAKEKSATYRHFRLCLIDVRSLGNKKQNPHCNDCSSLKQESFKATNLLKSLNAQTDRQTREERERDRWITKHDRHISVLYGQCLVHNGDQAAFCLLVTVVTPPHAVCVCTSVCMCVCVSLSLHVFVF